AGVEQRWEELLRKARPDFYGIGPQRELSWGRNCPGSPPQTRGRCARGLSSYPDPTVYPARAVQVDRADAAPVDVRKRRTVRGEMDALRTAARVPQLRGSEAGGKSTLAGQIDERDGWIAETRRAAIANERPITRPVDGEYRRIGVQPEARQIGQ